MRALDVPLLLALATCLVSAAQPGEILAQHPAARALRLSREPMVAIDGLPALTECSDAGDGHVRLTSPESPIAITLRVRAYETAPALAVRYGGSIENTGEAPVSLGVLRAVDLTLGSPGAGTDGRYAYEPLEYRAEEWWGSTFWTGPDWTRVGKDWQHSGARVSSCRAFVAPKAGRIVISGAVRKADTGGGDGVRASIRLKGDTLFEAEIDGGDAVGSEHRVEVEVAEGDAIRFVVHRRGDIPFDTTYWDPVIEYADGEAYRASEGFGDAQGVWRYELECDRGESALAPVVHAPDGRFVWREHALPQSGVATLWSPLAAEEGRSLPCFLYSGDQPDATFVLAPLSPGLWGMAMSRDASSGRVSLLCRPSAGPISLGPGERIAFPEVLVASVSGGWQVARDLVWSAHSGLPFTPPPGPLGLQGLAPVDDPSPQPETPTDLVADPSGGAASLRWSAAADEARGYLVLRDGRPIGSVAGAAFTDPAPPSASPPRYAVAAVDGYALSPPIAAWRSNAPAWKRDIPADLASLVEADWEGADAGALTSRGYAAVALESLDAARGVLSRRSGDPEGLREACDALERDIRAGIAPADGADRSAYLAARWLRREALLSDPLLGGFELLLTKRVPAAYSHLVMQYFGWRARPGGGLYALESPGRSLVTRPLLDPARWTGSVFAPVLSWDADRVAFSYSACDPADPCFHLFELDLATGLAAQLTSGPFEDLMPAYLPDGDLMLVSTRRRGHARCFGGQFGPDWHVYTLHRLFRETGEVRTLSYHETNEWFPTVQPDGSVAYARWDYVDRHAVLHQNLWRTNPDGTNPATLYGNNTQNPHCSFEAQVVPGTTKLLCTASAHHSVTGGSLILVDANVDYDGPAPIERLTPEVPFPESEAVPQEYYASPWPLSEDLYLCAYSPSPLIMEPPPNEPAALGLYLLDRWGNREILYRDPVVGCSNPIPIRPRPTPPARPSLLPPDAPPVGAFAIQDIQRGLDGVPAGAIKAIRVIQVLPKTTPIADDPPIGLAGQEPARAVLGTAPVADDGSAYFEAPARVPLLFQALDEKGRAIQTMRSVTYLQAGERTMCVGCHEPRNTSPALSLPEAVGREPSRLAPGPDGARPFSYPRLVQPVLDKRCVSCHGDDNPDAGMSLTSTPEGPWTRSYLSLTGGPSFLYGNTNAEHARESLVPRYGGWNPVHRTEAGGAYGALGSRLIALLEAGHEGVTLEPDELARIALWIDCNAVFYGTYDRDDQRAQLAGAIVPMPEIQ